MTDNINRNPRPGKDEPDSPASFASRAFAVFCMVILGLIIFLVVADFILKPLIARLFS